MALRDDTKGGLRKLLLPAAASLAGAGAGLALTRTEKLRDALPTLDDVGMGDLADDLRTKLNSVVGKVDSMAGGARPSSGSSSRPLDSAELEARRRAREERRKQRAGR
ncbi:MAG: hypothetical protein E6G36_13905 [Actinobacteria bacterium]|nr:MAG: hypothetical protein E6G36_13905 [Actinomycetota bacterium]